MSGELDADTGDISLAFSSAGPLPARHHHIPSRVPTADREHDVAVPVPQRLFSKTLFSRGESSSPRGPSSSSSKGVFGPESSPSVSLNDDEDAGRATPSTSTSSKYWGKDSIGLGFRPSSAQPPTASDRDPSPSTIVPFPAQPPGPTRRTSSTLGRSRSLHARMPSTERPTVDTSSATTNGTHHAHRSSPMSATTARPTPSSKLGWTRRPGEPRPPPLMSESVARGMSRWVKEVVVCNFDLERGPVVERRAGRRRWGPGEKENVAFSSFPDTSLFSEGSILFSFKIRHIPPDPASLSQPEPPSPMPDRVTKTVEEELHDLSVSDPPGEANVLPGESSPATGVPTAPMSMGEKAAEYRRWNETREWTYGYVWFEQRRDKGITRGYMQKSLVILTHLPFPLLFSTVLQRVAPAFFEYGYSTLEAACHSIASWPDPTPDAVFQLPLMSGIISVKLPDTTQSPQIGEAFSVSSASPAPLLASLPTSTPLRAFASFLPALWSLWECLILAEPVLVIAPDPKTCSEIVWWLRDLLRPIPPAGDFRPYLHIHDHDFSLLVNASKPQPGVVVGVTNPFFRNAASHWPNVISIQAQRPRRLANGGGSSAGPGSGYGGGVGDGPEGFASRRHRSVQKDRVLLKRLEALVAEGKLDDPEGNEALRTHFQQLTERFLVPLNRYFQTLVPTRTPVPSPIPYAPPPHQITTHLTTPSFPALSAPSPSASPALSTSSTTAAIRPFSLPTFLALLRTQGPNPLLFRTKGLSTKSRVENDFYASFCMSATFAGWLAGRVESLGGAFAALQGTPVPGSANPASAYSNGGGSAVGNGGLTVPSRSHTPRSPSSGPGSSTPGSRRTSTSTSDSTSYPDSNSDSHPSSVAASPHTAGTRTVTATPAVTPRGAVLQRPAFGRSASVGLGISGGNVDPGKGMKDGEGFMVVGSSEDDDGDE